MDRHSTCNGSHRSKSKRPPVFQHESSKIHYRRGQQRENDEGQSSQPPTYTTPKTLSIYPKVDYKPAAFKWPFLLALIVAVAMLMALMGVALHNFPGEEESSRIKLRANSLLPVKTIGRGGQNINMASNTISTLDSKITPIRYSSRVQGAVTLQKYPRGDMMASTAGLLEPNRTMRTGSYNQGTVGPICEFIPKTSYWPTIGTQTVTEIRTRPVPQPSPVPITSTITTEQITTPSEIAAETTRQETNSPHLILSGDPLYPNQMALMATPRPITKISSVITAS